MIEPKLTQFLAGQVCGGLRLLFWDGDGAGGRGVQVPIDPG